MDINTLEVAPIIMELARIIHQINTRELEPARIGSGQKRMMKLIIEEPGLKQSVLSRALGLHKSTVSRTIKGLEDRNYIRRSRHPTGKPDRGIYPTKLGRLMYRYSHLGLDFLELQLADGFTREEFARFAEYLFRARSHLRRPPWDSLTPLQRMELQARVATERGKCDTSWRLPIPLNEPPDLNEGT